MKTSSKNVHTSLADNLMSSVTYTHCFNYLYTKPNWVLVHLLRTITSTYLNFETTEKKFFKKK